MSYSAFELNFRFLQTQKHWRVFWGSQYSNAVIPDMFWMFQSAIWIVLAFILTRLCYCICLTAFKQQKTCTTYLNNTREIKVKRMHCQQMKIKKSCCLKKEKNSCCKMLLKFSISNSESCWWFILIEENIIKSDKQASHCLVTCQQVFHTD